MNTGANIDAKGWQPIDDCADLHARLQQAQAALVLWGGAHCGVCHVLQPRLADMAAQHFTHLPLLYVDCQSSPAACAQYGVFTLPVLRLYVDGRIALEYARAFGVAQVRQEVADLLWRVGLEPGND